MQGTHLLIVHHRLKEIFPKLTQVDRRPVQSVVDFQLPSSVTSVRMPECKDSFFDSQRSQAFAIGFVNQVSRGASRSLAGGACSPRLCCAVLSHL
jgi:hypothetical protein